MGEPGAGYPWHWTVVPWIEGAEPTAELIDPEEWATSLAAFVRACRAVPGLGGPVCTSGRGDRAIELNAMWGYLPEQVSGLYREALGLDEAAYRRARGFALAPAINGMTYYRDSAPHLARLNLRTVQRLTASLD